jgi:ABC-type lipoprotein export system ATPase subunit
MLKRLHRERGTTTLMVIHHTHILELADRIATLEDGQCATSHPPRRRRRRQLPRIVQVNS